MISIMEMYRGDIQTLKGTMGTLSNCMGQACIDRMWAHIVIEIISTANRDPDLTPDEVTMLQSECIRR